MAKAIKLQDFKKVLTLATSSTKKLVKTSVQGKENFPELLVKYKWSGTRDFNMALIIIALYAYCLTKDNLKNITKKVIVKDKSDEKGLKSTLGALRHGNDPKIATCLEQDFDEKAQKLIFDVSEKPVNLETKSDETITIQIDEKDLTQEEFENMLNKTFEGGLFKQAKKR